jgi:ketosteroid isomerase-like protein
MSHFDSPAFAHEWINAWNSHALEAILAHYAEDVVFTSPFALKLAPESGGTLHGKTALRAYFANALETFPDLKFELLHVTQSVRSVVLVYRSVNHLLAAEMMEANENNQIARVIAHYGDQAAL